MSRSLGWAMAVAMVLVAACSGGPATSTPTPTPNPTASPAPTDAPAPTPTPFTGQVSLQAPDTVTAGADFEVTWTGPAATGDFVTLMAPAAGAWTNEPYFNTTAGSPATLRAPLAEGAYELRYIADANDEVIARRAITVTELIGSLSAPAAVAAGTPFEVAWTGPDGSGDFVTIVRPDATGWAGESYFDTAHGSPGTLVAPIETGAYELWYVSRAGDQAIIRRPITVTALVVTLQAPSSVKVGTEFDVTWTGPNGPSDYITIVAAGAAPGAYLSYVYTASGSPARLTAPTDPGNYEIRYQTDRGSAINVTFALIPITVAP